MQQHQQIIQRKLKKNKRIYPKKVKRAWSKYYAAKDKGETKIAGAQEKLDNYKAKAEFYVRQHQDNAVIAKLKGNVPLTEKDVSALEEILWRQLGTKQDYEAEYGQKPLGEFVREIVGLDMTAAKEAFAEYLNDAALDSRQIYFVNQIVEYIVHNGLMKDLSVLQEPPFTDQGSIVEVFGQPPPVGQHPQIHRANQRKRNRSVKQSK